MVDSSAVGNDHVAFMHSAGFRHIEKTNTPKRAAADCMRGEIPAVGREAPCFNPQPRNMVGQLNLET
jgi:hypothetical protein